MPSLPRYSRQSRSGSPTVSSPAYSVSHATALGPQKLNIVTRVAIEGAAERGKNNVTIRMYMRISLPVDSVTPGAAIPLFPEENLKILRSHVHPLDAHSAPYHFSTKELPLLHKAMRALNLPDRLSQTYEGSIRSSSTEPAALVERYCGQVTVSSYHISYILPKEILRQEVQTPGRRTTTMVQFMAAIEMLVPYTSQPPHAPYFLAIPVPRCLSNQIKLKIFPPNEPKKTSSSLASLSSADEDLGTWDLTCDPHVTRNVSNRLSRTYSYNNFADDESSDASSAGFSDVCVIQGSFPSTDRMRIRWARPTSTTSELSGKDGRRRVGIKEVKADMTCKVLGTSGTHNPESPPYEATCKGVWFPGVATLLGLDVQLEADNCLVEWASEKTQSWTVTGGPGFTGHAPALSRQPSTDNPSICVLPSSPDARGPAPVRHDSSSSTSSLLRAPLPLQAVPDYSFESTPASTPVSSLSSLPMLSSPENGRRSRTSSTNTHYTDTDVTAPIIVHLNMNELLPPSKHDFKFSISGTVVVTPKPLILQSSRRYMSSPNPSRPGSDSEDAQDVLATLRFRIATSDREHLSVTVKNDAHDGDLDVFNAVGDIRDARTLKAVLHRGGQVRCGSDGARVTLRPSHRSPSPIRRGRMNGVHESARSRSRPGTPNGLSYHDVSPSTLHSLYASALRTPIRQITPLWAVGSSRMPSYAVRIIMPALSEEDQEWLEFGLASPRSRSDIASASFETRGITKASRDDKSFGTASAKEWATLVRIHVGEVGGGKLEILYIVHREEGQNNEKAEQRSVPQATVLSAVLPSFQLPVGELEVSVPVQSDFDVVSSETNLAHEQVSVQGRKLIHYSLPGFFCPTLILAFLPPQSVTPPARPPRLRWSWNHFLTASLLTACLVLLISLWQTQLQLSQATRPTDAVDAAAPDRAMQHAAHPQITITTTAAVETTSVHSRWLDHTHIPASHNAAIPKGTPSPPPPPEAPAAPSPISTVTPSPISTADADPAYDLVPSHYFPAFWPIQFEFPAMADLDIVNVTMDTALRISARIYWLCRRLIHYPLPPP
ncbi:uncharacterized protein BXZ73DRAFT_86103 [Epithele typhae]|uniref:uncharacterized protein n=1 Tax=Epithele typhae TaxID=378194 RepID=UPI00200891C5|nr:uncharacterized protein BXZ73DRAFT_86103 [Epithele typhae]KAH9945847.1 hypothetical protein BXZ73DRAFT_86103 [Epithele typhae]